MSGTTSETPAAPARPADHNRRQLIDAAAEVFAERGYEGARVADIARRAGLTTGAIYSRYSGKAQLLLDAIADRMPGEVAQILSGQGTTEPDRLLAALGSHLVSPENNTHGLLLEVFVASRREPEVAEQLHAILDEERTRLGDLIRAAQTAGIFDPDLPVDAIVSLSMAIGLGMHLSNSLGRPRPDPDDWRIVIDRMISSASPDWQP